MNIRTRSSTDPRRNSQYIKSRLPSTHNKSQWLIKKSSSKEFTPQVVAIIGPFLTIRAFTTPARTLGLFSGSIKNNKKQLAQGVLEKEVSEIPDQLNTQHRYLWVNGHDSIEGSCSQSNIGGCSNIFDDHGRPKTKVENYSDALELDGTEQPVTPDPGKEVGKQAKRGRRKSESYTFYGDPWIAGRGVIRVRGAIPSAQRSAKHQSGRHWNNADNYKTGVHLKGFKLQPSKPQQET